MQTDPNLHEVVDKAVKWPALRFTESALRASVDQEVHRAVWEAVARMPGGGVSMPLQDALRREVAL